MDLASVDYFTDPSLMADAYEYYEAVRAKGPVWREPHYGAFMVTGHDEISAICRDPETFSSCNSFAGPFVEFPDEPDNPDDFGALIDKYRHTFAFSENFITFDPPEHTAHRALMMRLLTPKRLEENEGFMQGASDALIDRFVDSGACEFAGDFAQPYSLVVIADLLGIPEEDHQVLRQRVIEQGPAGKLGKIPQGNILGFLEEFFTPYIEERRREPRDDVLTAMAHARFPDGSLPEVTMSFASAPSCSPGAKERRPGSKLPFSSSLPNSPTSSSACDTTDRSSLTSWRRGCVSRAPRR